jgi:hypothetical protein
MRKRTREGGREGIRRNGKVLRRFPVPVLPCIRTVTSHSGDGLSKKETGVQPDFFARRIRHRARRI